MLGLSKILAMITIHPATPHRTVRMVEGAGRMTWSSRLWSKRSFAGPILHDASIRVGDDILSIAI